MYKQSKTKPFFQPDYDVNDKRARDAAERMLTKLGHTIIKNEEDYSVDITSTCNGKKWHTEAEVKVIWENKWPTVWRDVHVLYRKGKLLGIDNLVFLLFSDNLEYAVAVKKEKVVQAPQEEVSNRINPSGEFMYIVPLKDASLYSIDKLTGGVHREEFPKDKNFSKTVDDIDPWFGGNGTYIDK